MAEMNQTVPQFQYPDLLGSYLRGLSVPGQLQAQQQQNEMGALNIDQLRLAVGNQQMFQDASTLPGSTVRYFCSRCWAGWDHISFNGKFRDECLNEHWFRTLHEAREIVGR